MKKIIATVFSALIFSWLAAAEKGFELKIAVQNNEVNPGETVKLIAEPTFPADYKPLYWKVYAKTKDLPENFAEKAKTHVDKYGVNFLNTGKLKHPKLKATFSFPRKPVKTGAYQLEIDTTNWPAGKYNFTLQLLHVHKNPAALKDKKKQYIYSYAPVVFTVNSNEKAASVAAKKAPVKSNTFGLKVIQKKSVFKPGEDITFEVIPTYPEEYNTLYYRIYMQGKGLPAKFAEKTGAEVNKYNVHYIVKGKLKHPNAQTWFYFPKNKGDGAPVELSFSSAGWPAGSYTVDLQVMHVHKDAKNVKDPKKKYPYGYSKVSFTIEEPAKAAAGETAAAVFNKLPWQGNFTNLKDGKTADVQTRFKYFAKNGTLYFSIEALEPEMSKILLDKMPADSGDIWRNDSIEISVATDADQINFYKFLFDAAGQTCDLKMTDDNTNRNIYNLYPEWNSSFSVKTEKKQSSWTACVQIPLAAMVNGNSKAENFRFNIVRHRRAGKKLVTTTFAKLPSRAMHRPLEFVKLAVKDFNPAFYNIKVENINIAYPVSGKMQFTALLKAENSAADMIRTVYTLSSNKNTFTSGTVEPLTAKTHRKIFAELEGMQDGVYQFTYDIYSNSFTPVLLATGSFPVELVYNPLKLEINNPAYRNIIFATMPDKNLTFTVKNEFDKPLALTAVLRGKNVDLKQAFTAQVGSTIRSFDMSKLADGEYILSITDGKKLTRKERIRKLPYQKGEVWLDKQGITYIDGVKTLPFGWCGTQPYQPDKSLNVLTLHTRFADIEHAKKVIAENFAKGQRTACYFTQELTGKAWDKVKLFAYSELKGGMNDKQKEKLRTFAKAVSQCEGFFAYYMADEPEGKNSSPLFYEQALEIIREVDPYHPGFMLNYGLDGIKRFYKGGDVLMPDCYPQYFEDDSTTKKRTAPSEWMKTATQFRPSWLCTQMTMWPYRSADGKLRGIAPDYRDQRMQFLQALVHNAKGFSMYTFYRGQFDSNVVIGHVELGQTLQLLKDYLLENSLADGVKMAREDDSVQIAVKKYNGKFCLIAVNTSQQSKKLALTFKHINKHKLYEAGGNSALDIAQGKAQLTLQPKESKIFISDQILAGKVPSVAEVEKRIAELKKNRKKPGNLVGTGELYEADYRDMKKGKIPVNFTHIKVSSEKPNYTTQDFGTLYFLLDGLTEPQWADFMWTPLKKDQTPWIELELPAEQKISKVKLYSPGATLAAGKVIVGKTVTEFNAAGKKSMEITFAPVHSKIVRIEFDRSGVKPIPGAYADRFLSEIEVY